MADPTYRIRGIGPPDLAAQPSAVRLMFYGWVVELGLKQKDLELAKGLDRDGKPLRAISARTRKYRRSAMTPSGKGDPSAPPLMPARALSRTRSLLAGRATPDAAVFYWRFDVFTGDGWGRVLAVHRRRGRDVIGLSPAGTARVRALAWDRWERWKAGKPIPAAATATAGPGIPRVGSYSTKFATFGIGAQAPPKFLEGASTGGMTFPEWRRYLTQPNPTPVAIPGRAAGPYNRLLAHVWGNGGPSPPKAPTPKPEPKPKPAAPATLPRKRSERLKVMVGWRASLTADEREGLKAYVGHGYRAINEYLRMGRVPANVAVLPDAGAALDRHIARVDAALAKARLDADRLLYRGIEDMATMGLDPADLVGARIADAGFLSTSALKSSAESFTREHPGTALIRIRARAGLPGGYVGELAEHESEQEFLFARGMTLVITKARKVKDPLGGADYWILDAELTHGG